MKRSVPGIGQLAAETNRLLEMLTATKWMRAALAALFAKVRAGVDALRGRAALR